MVRLGYKVVCLRSHLGDFLAVVGELFGQNSNRDLSKRKKSLLSSSAEDAAHMLVVLS